MNMPSPPLADCAVLVVGGSSGIGRGVALASALWGARVAVVGRRRTETEATAAELGGHAVLADIRQPADCRRIAEEATAALGQID